MAAPARIIRSNAAPAGREPDSEPRPTRPQLRVIQGNRDRKAGAVGGFRHFLVWTNARRTPLLYMGVAVAFLAASLVGSLALRTQMVQDSFESSNVQSHIATLTQDVQDYQAKLDDLQASLPQKAQQMGMVPQQGSVSIDLNGYRPSSGSKQ